jgi:hypothetical protein
MKNLEQLVMTRALVKEEIRQGKWDQGSWATELVKSDETGLREPSCGTTACVAGWAVIVDGGKFLNAGAVAARPEELEDPNLLTWKQEVRVPKTGQWVEFDTISVAARARRLLGLNYHEAEELFRASRTEDEIMDLLKQHIKDARAQRKAEAKAAKKKLKRS